MRGAEVLRLVDDDVPVAVTRGRTGAALPADLPLAKSPLDLRLAVQLQACSAAGELTPGPHAVVLKALFEPFGEPPDGVAVLAGERTAAARSACLEVVGPRAQYLPEDDL